MGPIALFLEQSDNPQRQRGFRQKVASPAAISALSVLSLNE
jgi:hypothetical protein